ncbi:MAG: type II toxin-antitoxin system VapC family toxin [Actinomycetota bacterium]
MRIVDANILIHAVNADSRHHDAARRWLDAALGGGDVVGLAWTALLAFVRLTTRPGMFPRPLPVEAALAQVDGWLAAPGAVVVHPTAEHARHLRELLGARGAGGNLVPDAHLAALALEHRARIVSYDADFTRFAGVRVDLPEDLLA